MQGHSRRAAATHKGERHLRHLERLGVFETIAGLVVGKPVFPAVEGAPFGFDELWLEIVGAHRTYPVVTGFDCGHTHPMLTLAQLVPITLTTRDGTAEVVVEEPAVRA